MTPDLIQRLQQLDPHEPLLVALDFDGTLSHLVDEPGRARPAPGVLHWLTQLERAPSTRVAIISGRALHDLAEVSGAADIALLVGSHGQEHGPNRGLEPDESQLLADTRAALAGLESVAGVVIENKPAGLAVHVRNCDEADARAVLDRVHAVAAQRPGLNLIEGKMVVEVSVRQLDKGGALVALIRRLSDPRVIFAGDDVTDEAAMAVLAPEDITIKVGAGDSIARYRIADPSEMVEVLALIARARAGAGETGGESRAGSVVGD